MEVGDPAQNIDCKKFVSTAVIEFHKNNKTMIIWYETFVLSRCWLCIISFLYALLVLVYLLYFDIFL